MVGRISLSPGQASSPRRAEPRPTSTGPSRVDTSVADHGDSAESLILISRIMMMMMTSAAVG